jgi:hypothetical protein
VIDMVRTGSIKFNKVVPLSSAGPSASGSQVDKTPLPNEVELVLSLDGDPLLDSVFPAKHLDHSQGTNS